MLFFCLWLLFLAPDLLANNFMLPVGRIVCREAMDSYKHGLCVCMFLTPQNVCAAIVPLAAAAFICHLARNHSCFMKKKWMFMDTSYEFIRFRYTQLKIRSVSNLFRRLTVSKVGIVSSTRTVAQFVILQAGG
jgi:hypothetical protein